MLKRKEPEKKRKANKKEYKQEIAYMTYMANRLAKELREKKV
jgi:hypothetical protein